MKKLLLLPITLPLGMARGAIEGALRTAADALMDLADGGRADADVYVPEPVVSTPPPPPPPSTAVDDAAEAIEDLVADLEDEDVDLAGDAVAAGVAGRRVTPEPGTPAAEVAARDVAADLGLQTGHTEEEPDALFESEGAADPGAELRVDEPWPGYGMMRA